MDILVISPSHASPLAAAATFRRQRPAGDIIFVTAPERLANVRRMLPFSPEIADARVLPANAGLAELRRALAEACESVTRRQAADSLQSRLNARISEVTRLGPRDLAEHHEGGNALTERYLSTILRNAPDALVATSCDGAIVGWNAAATRLFEASWDEVSDKDFTSLVAHEDRTAAAALLAQAAAGESVTPQELRVQTRDGAFRTLEVSAGPIGGGAIVGVSLIARDITRRKRNEARLLELNGTLEQRVADEVAKRVRTEEALRQSQKMEAVGQLTGGLAHDFNNLLTGVTGNLELMRRRIMQGRTHDLERYVTAAHGAAERAAALTHRLLAFSRRQTLDPKPTDVNRLVRGMEELVRRTVGPAIEVEPMVAAGGLWPTLVDPGLLENALLNLCINSRDAMPQGGRITIETGNRWLDERAARERGVPPGQYVSLCVSDTGTGMPPEVIEKALDPFFTTKPIGQGTGLGLSMIYGFARQSGGQVRIYSEVGQGTMVCQYLPRHFGAGEAAEPVPHLEEAPRAEQGETVLVVDDEPTVRMLVSEVLQELGYQVIEAPDGPAALRVLQSPRCIDLLVTDVGLPGGMNGRQVADAARVERPGMKVLFITGFAENAVLSHGHLDPGMHVLTKPFTLEALGNRIRQIITG
ncbi:PAS domain-containing sensor histidine kinase [Roseomonas sp. 18066]|uniref:hybrid sensor histidine kinase/response regulator n=1 Tax=Roseomonas sp. 18066 TaxID=2681412 RepID=UPI00190F26D2|nr:response regulator [Roseomonas sp. 18066]